MHFSPLLTLTISLMLGCTAKSLMPEGTSPGAAVSPLGRPTGMGMGALMVVRGTQSRVRVMAIWLSSDALMSFPLDGKKSEVMLELWWRKEPNSLFLRFSVMEVPCREGSLGLSLDIAGGRVETWYRFMRSSVLPVASRTFPLPSGLSM